MPILIHGASCFDAWYNTAEHLCNQPTGEDTNIVVSVTNPCDFTDLPQWVIQRNPKRIMAREDNIRHVINTIFPYQLKRHYPNRHDFYNKYEAIYATGRNRRWGTYFQRLISFGRGFNHGQTNQLEAAIRSLRGGSPQRFFITFHLTAVNVESNVRPLGGPCWQFGEVIRNSAGQIDLVAVYRNHDYFNKALGNFIGLAKLLEFICQESGQVPGQLIIHSIHGYSSTGTVRLRQLMT